MSEINEPLLLLVEAIESQSGVCVCVGGGLVGRTTLVTDVSS